MLRHTNAICTLAITIRVKAKFSHCFLIKGESFFALVETILDGMGTDFFTVRAFAIAQPIIMVLKMRIIIIIDYLFKSVNGFEHWLTVVTETTLEPNRILSRPQHYLHKIMR